MFFEYYVKPQMRIPELVVAVMTTPTYEGARRRQAHRETWHRDRRVQQKEVLPYFFVGRTGVRSSLLNFFVLKR